MWNDNVRASSHFIRKFERIIFEMQSFSSWRKGNIRFFNVICTNPTLCIASDFWSYTQPSNYNYHYMTDNSHSDIMIETEGLSKYYGDFIAVEDLSF